MLSSALNTRFISKLKSERNELNKNIKRSSLEYKLERVRYQKTYDAWYVETKI